MIYIIGIFLKNKFNISLLLCLKIIDLATLVCTIAVYCNCMFILAQHKKKSQTFCQILFQIIVKTVQGDEIV